MGKYKVNFRQLPNFGWGREFSTLKDRKEFADSPDNWALALGYLQLILEELIKLNKSKRLKKK